MPSDSVVHLRTPVERTQGGNYALSEHAERGEQNNCGARQRNFDGIDTKIAMHAIPSGSHAFRATKKHGNRRCALCIQTITSSVFQVPM